MITTKVFILCIFCICTVKTLLYERKECRRSRKGSEYMGTVSSTVSGRPCQRWDSQTPHTHDFTEPLRFPDRNFTGSNNYCRNPDLQPSLWCFTTDPDVISEPCDVPSCDDVLPGCSDVAQKSDADQTQISYCKPSPSCLTTAEGQEYTGKRGMTVSGRPCQRWDVQYPHPHTYTNPNMFPESNLTMAENYCRNPNGERSSPWCYTMDVDVEWEYCDLPLCQGCKHSVDGTGYMGTEMTSQSGLPCEAWTNHGFTNSDLFPDVTAEAAANYCRNPDGKAGGLWCYTGVDQWEFCDIQLCEEMYKRDNKERRQVKHVVHFGIDGIHSTCWRNASSGTPNLNRLTQEGAYTFRGLAELGTDSGTNWGAHLCGMGNEETGISFNTWNPPWMGYTRIPRITPVTGLHYPMPCVFNYFKGLDANIRTSSFTNWDWFYTLTGWGNPGSTDLNYFCEGEYPQGLSCDWEIILNASSFIPEVIQSSLMSYTFVSVDEVDSQGHKSRWCSEQYLEAVDVADEMLGMLLDAIEGQDVLLVVGSDHGGDNGHGRRRDSDLLIPTWIRGPGVKANYEIQGHLKNRDLLPTIAWAMGIEGSPYWNGRVLYEIFTDPNEAT